MPMLSDICEIFTNCPYHVCILDTSLPQSKFTKTFGVTKVE